MATPIETNTQALQALLEWLQNQPPAYTYGTADLTAGTSALASGTVYFVYE